MSTKLFKSAYQQLIDEDISVLNKYLPDCIELDHIKHIIRDSVKHYYPDCAHISTVQDCELAISETKKKAIKAFKDNCQHPKDAKGCECVNCIRYIGRNCELLDGFIEKLNE